MLNKKRPTTLIAVISAIILILTCSGLAWANGDDLAGWDRPLQPVSIDRNGLTAKITVASSTSISNSLDIADIEIMLLQPEKITAGDFMITAPTGLTWDFTNAKFISADDDELTNFSFAASASTGQDLSKIILSIDNPALFGEQENDISYLTGLKLIAADDATEGDVDIHFSGCGITAQSEKAGIFAKPQLMLSVEDEELPMLINGRYPKSATDPSIQALTVTFSEGAKNSWLAGQDILFSLPAGVKIRAAEIISHSGLKGQESLAGQVLLADAEATERGDATWSVDADGLKISGEELTGTSLASLKMTFYLSIAPGFEGDIDLTVSGDAIINDLTATIATAISPFKIEAEETAIEIGGKDIATSDIIITESVAGALQKTDSNSSMAEGSPLIIAVEDIDIVSNSAEVEVTDGDINIEKIAYDNEGNLLITIQQESTEASTIEITGLTVDADRTLPQGGYELQISGSAVANYSDTATLTEATFATPYYTASEDYVTITTNAGLTSIAEPLVTEKVSVTIGSSSIMVDDEVIYMDTEPFISGGYTYIPIRSISTALGVPDQNVMWNAADKSVLLDIDGLITKMQVGSSVISVGGAEMVTSSPMIIKDDRAFLPFRVLGELVLDVPVSWDEASRTATFN